MAKRRHHGNRRPRGPIGPLLLLRRENMGKQQEKKAPATPDKLFVFGMDDKGKPRGARFP